MEQLLFDMLFWGSVVGGSTFFLIFASTMAIKQCKQPSKKNKETHKNQAGTPSKPEYTTVTIKATVADRCCCVKTIGTKTPKTIKEFSVVFQAENGDILKFNVPEDMYDGFEKGQCGILTVVDGDVYGFALEEEDSKA